MTNFSRPNSGMTLMNVMLALAIAGSVLTPIFINQAGMMERMRDESQAVRRLFAALHYLYEAEIALLQEKMPEQKKLTRPPMQLSFSEADPAKNSALARFHGVKVRSVMWQWADGRMRHKDQLMSVVYTPPKKQEK